MAQVYVVDAGVLFSTWTLKVPEATIVTTSNILTEVRNRPSQSRTDVLMILNRMRAVNPLDEYIREVEKGASKSGDRSVLSENDIELIALALMLTKERENLTLVSTDLAVLNTARHLKIATLDPSGKFRQEITWSMKCPACQYKAEAPTRDTECPVCGTTMKRTPLRRRKSV